MIKLSAYEQVTGKNSFQLTVYCLAARANGLRDREILLRLDCLIKTKTPRFEQYYSVCTPEDEKQAVKKMLSVWKGIEKGVYISHDTSWRYSTCDFSAACDKWLKS